MMPHIASTLVKLFLLLIFTVGPAACIHLLDLFEEIAALFSRLFRRLLTPGASSNHTKQLQEIYLRCLAGMLAKLAKADGRICEEEIKIIESFMQQRLKLSPDERSRMIGYFANARDSDRSFHSYLSEFIRHFRYERAFAFILMEILIELAEADKITKPIEASLLRQSAIRLDLESYFFLHGQQTSWDRPRGENFSQDRRDSHERSGQSYDHNISRCYSILGCHPTDSISKIKKKYRMLVKQYHPDALVSHGLPNNLQEIAHEQFIQVQKAFETIIALRGNK